MTEQPLSSPSPPTGDSSQVGDQFSAVINCHDCNLAQIEAALAANMHDVDPHPGDPSKQVKRHPVYLVAEDYSQLDSEGRPKPGAPTELDLTATRDIFHKRYDWVSDQSPPADGSFVRVAGMHFIAEMDQAGNATGRVVLGEPTA